MATHTIGGLDFEVLRRAIEGPDAETLVGLYAEVITVNRSTTPSSPQILRGKEQIGGRLRNVCGREITHRVENEVLGGGRVAFQEACEYPDGTRVLGAETLEAGGARRQDREASQRRGLGRVGRNVAAGFHRGQRHARNSPAFVTEMRSPRGPLRPGLACDRKPE